MNGASYAMRIEEDPRLVGSFFLVAIYRLDNTNKRELIGIPMRGVRYEAAAQAMPHLRFAFEYGLSASRADVVKSLYCLPCSASEGT